MHGNRISLPWARQDGSRRDELGKSDPEGSRSGFRSTLGFLRANCGLDKMRCARKRNWSRREWKMFGAVSAFGDIANSSVC